MVGLVGYIMLHELMHGDTATYGQNGKVHISVLRYLVEYVFARTEEGVRLYKKNPASANACGALNTRILARTDIGDMKSIGAQISPKGWSLENISRR